MNDKIVVNTEGIREVALNIDKKRQEIINIFNQDINNILNLSENCFKVSGLNYSDVKSSFNSVFNQLDERLSALTKVLNEKIIPMYENSSNNIRSMFNNNFAEDMKKTFKVHTLRILEVSMYTNELFIDGYKIPKPLSKQEVYDLLDKIKQGDEKVN